MKYIFYILIVTFLLSSTAVLTSNASSEGLVLSAESTKLEYKYNQPPAISGNVTDSDGNPLSRVSVHASFPYIKSENVSSESDELTLSSTIIGYTTFSDGKFLLNPTNPSPPGEHTIKVTAKKDQIVQIIYVTFNVKEDGNIIKGSIDAEAKANMERTVLSYQVLEKKMEIQKENYQEIQNPVDNVNLPPRIVMQQITQPQIAKQQATEQQIAKLQIVEQQIAKLQIVKQQISSNSLEDDLKKLEEKHASNSPRNAFAGFIETVDLTLRNLFWAQFEFTQNKTDLAHQAKIDALNEGQNSQEAMIVFQETAATPLAELVEFNEMLNVKNGFTNQTLQDSFDENGKLSRTGE